MQCQQSQVGTLWEHFGEAVGLCVSGEAHALWSLFQEQHPHQKEECFREASIVPFCRICSLCPTSCLPSHIHILPESSSFSPHALSPLPIHWGVGNPGSNLTPVLDILGDLG